MLFLIRRNLEYIKRFLMPHRYPIETRIAITRIDEYLAAMNIMMNFSMEISSRHDKYDYGFVSVTGRGEIEKLYLRLAGASQCGPLHIVMGIGAEASLATRNFFHYNDDK